MYLIQIIKILEKLTGNKYEAKNGTVKKEHYRTLDPLGFYSNRFVGAWGIGKKSFIRFFKATQSIVSRVT